MPILQQAGKFRGPIISYGVIESEKDDSESVAITLEVAIEDIFYEGKWQDYREYGLTVMGAQYVIKRDGTVNKRTAESLMICAGWDGSLESVAQGSWTPTPIAFSVKEELYNGELQHRINWINPYESGGSGNVDAEKAKAYDAKIGSHFRAIAATVGRNSAKPATAAPSKPAAPAAAPPAPDGTPEADEVPF